MSLMENDTGLSRGSSCKISNYAGSGLNLDANMSTMATVSDPVVSEKHREDGDQSFDLDSSAPSCSFPSSPTRTSVTCSVSSTNYHPGENEALPGYMGQQGTQAATSSRDRRSGPAPTIATNTRQSFVSNATVDPATLLRRLFNNSLYSDIRLTVDEATFHMHRGVLAEQCSYFRELFEVARTQEPTAEIKVLDCSCASITLEHARRFPVTPAEGDPSAIIRDESREVTRDTAKQRMGLDLERITDGDQGQTMTNGREDDTGVYYGGNGDGSSRLQNDGSAAATADLSQGAREHIRQGNSGLSVFSQHEPATRSRSDNLFPTSSSTQGSSFSVTFVATERSSGYKSHHFGVFLQILYGILSPLQIREVDLLPVFRIAYIYGVPSLVNFLGDRIFECLELNIETWPSVLRFTERYRLEDIKQRAIAHAGDHRELWTMAVEMLELDDFKAFLRGVQPENVKNEARKGVRSGDMRRVKDELLTMFLLVHYQDKNPEDPPLQDEVGVREQGLGQEISEGKSGGSSGSMVDVNPSRQEGEEGEYGKWHLVRRISREYRKQSPGTKIRQQLQMLHVLPTRQQPQQQQQNQEKEDKQPGSRSTGLSATLRARFDERAALGNAAVPRWKQELPLVQLQHQSPHPHERPLPALPAQADKAERAKAWMRKFKHPFASPRN
ncbi:hypothetical protein BGZ58_003880 [Dissophora ornata]|nr:hypothetical protein BGZ58_003880 [Dissophora ornata]